jgi:uncharacterized protein YodC (DUF2158 family)
MQIRSVADNVTVTEQTPMTRPQTRRRTATAVIVAVAVLAAVAAVTVTVLSSSLLGGYSCSWFGERALASHEEFVSEWVPDASRFEVATYDCDSGGLAHLEFSTQSSPAEARDLLLAHPECRIDERDEEDGELVICQNGGQRLTIFLGESDERTRGELYI